MEHVVDTLTVTQTELPGLYWAGRLAQNALVYRTIRSQLGGGFGDRERHPHAWMVVVYVDGHPTQVASVRGTIREWTSLDRLERWLRVQGLRYWSVSNELDSIGLAADQ